jgi:hypothetical protein
MGVLPDGVRRYLDGDWSPVLYVLVIAGTCVALLYRTQGRLDDLVEKAPVLRFGEIHTHSKVYIYPNDFVNEVKMWRVALANDGGPAASVQVTGTFSPSLPDMPGSNPVVTFHRYADHSRTFLLQGNGATEYIDLVAVATHNHMVSFVASAEADGGYIYYEDDQFGKAQYWKLELEARAGVAIARRSVLIWFDGGQWMYMADDENGDPID